MKLVILLRFELLWFKNCHAAWLVQNQSNASPPFDKQKRSAFDFAAFTLATGSRWGRCRSTSRSMDSCHWVEKVVNCKLTPLLLAHMRTEAQCCCFWFLEGTWMYKPSFTSIHPAWINLWRSWRLNFCMTACDKTTGLGIKTLCWSPVTHRASSTSLILVCIHSSYILIATLLIHGWKRDGKKDTEIHNVRIANAAGINQGAGATLLEPGHTNRGYAVIQTLAVLKYSEPLKNKTSQRWILRTGRVSSHRATSILLSGWSKWIYMPRAVASSLVPKMMVRPGHKRLRGCHAMSQWVMTRIDSLWVVTGYLCITYHRSFQIQDASMCRCFPRWLEPHPNCSQFSSSQFVAGI